MVSRFLVVSSLVVFCCFTVVAGSMSKMFVCLLVVFGSFFRHCSFPPGSASSAVIVIFRARISPAKIQTAT
jgi:hypothetical protein